MTADARFARSDRLRAAEEFQRCFTHGERVNGRCFRLHVLAAPQPRLGLAVSRKVDTSAVVRNRIKRIARDSFRRSRTLLPACDCVLVAKREAAAASNDELRADLQKLWQRACALKASGPAGTMRDAPSPPSPRDA